MRFRAPWDRARSAYALGTAFYGMALRALVAATLVLGLGLGVEALSKLLGMPVPTVRDDPKRVEWSGLGLMMGYGLLAAAAIAGLWRLSDRMPARARHWRGRIAGTGCLLAVAVLGVLGVFNGEPVRGALLAFGAGCGALCVALVGFSDGN